MKLDFLSEPELEFGGSGRHVDIRRGLSLFGPLDSSAERPRTIRLGLVGTQQTVDGIAQWLEHCQRGIAAKESNQPNLFPEFPGFGIDSVFKTEFEIDSALIHTLSGREIERITRMARLTAIPEAEELIEKEIQSISEKGRPDVVIAAVPAELIDLEDDEETEVTAEFATETEVVWESATQIDLRHMLKAKVMRFNQPIQLVLPSTYDEAKRKRKKKGPEKRSLQDEATRAWNFHMALCYKANQRLWRIPRNSGDLHTCYIGISFYRALDEQENLMTSMAQVYDERGEGVIVRGKAVELSKDDRQPHLSRDDAATLLKAALAAYRSEHKHPPARVVMHKSSSYSAVELEGFNEAVNAEKLDSADFLIVSKSFSRLFRDGQYPPLRGTSLSLDDRTHLLYTRGSVPYYATYPGMYVPRPLKIVMSQAESSFRQTASEILSLTKLNWNNTQFDGSLPITMRVAHEVGKVLKYVPAGGEVRPKYSFYM